MECLSCLANAGIRPISPGRRIFESKYWLVEHAYPSSLEGWLVIVLKRHCEAFHLLTEPEFQDLGHLQYRLIKVVHEYFASDREYIFCFSEAEGFKHLHFHVVPKHHGFDPQYNGARAFHYLKAPEGEWIARDRVQQICEELHLLMQPGPS